MAPKTPTIVDRRTKRTQDLVFEAFSALVQTRRYDTFRVSDIIARAGIGRSTFYDHYANKDDVLLKSMEGPLSILARSICVGDQPSRLDALLEHFWKRRAVARTILAPPMLNLIGQRFAQMIVSFDDNLGNVCADNSAPRTKIQGTHIAFGLFAVIESWLAGRASMKQQDLVDWIVELGLSHRALTSIDQS
jgi:AcrR family transcriptional regulator